MLCEGPWRCGGRSDDNAFAFDAEGFIIRKANSICGAGKLYNTRMRYEDPEGDYGRQRRQREVLIELTNKLLFNSLLKYQEILDVIEHGETDFSFD